MAGTTLSCRVVGSGLRVTAEEPLHGQHGFGIMAARRQTVRLRLRSGIYAARDVARPAPVGGSRASRKNGGIALPCVPTRAHTQATQAWRSTRAQKFTSRECRARMDGQEGYILFVVFTLPLAHSCLVAFASEIKSRITAPLSY